MKAIHDRYYTTPPLTFSELRWRLQHISEEEYGVRVRAERASEDVAAQNIARAADGLS